MRFDWEAGNLSHIASHGVTQIEAEQVLLNDPFDLKYEVVKGEERWTSIGHTGGFRVLLVVWTLRGGDIVRAVTAREAAKSVRITYLREKGFGV